jgi:thioredoxin-related protein
MKKMILTSLMLLFLCITAFTQGIYDENIDADKQLDSVIEQADKEHKFIFAQVGGNWCKWCLMFNDLVTKNDTIKTLLQKDFIYIHINYSPNNKNEPTMHRLRNPHRFGFPVIVILDSKGQVIHTQNTSYLEEGNAYNVKKVIEFIKNWTPQAVGVSE